MIETRRRGANSKGELTAEQLVSEIISSVLSNVSKGSEKLNDFIQAYNKEFGNKFLWERKIVLSEIMPLIKGSLTLYALNMNGQVIIDLAGILERYAILSISELFRSFPERQVLINDLLSQRSLGDLAKDLVTLGLIFLLIPRVMTSDKMFRIKDTEGIRPEVHSKLFSKFATKSVGGYSIM